MIKTSVFERGGQWWFKWWNFNPPMPQSAPSAQDAQGPFAAKEDAERTRQAFIGERKKRYPFEQFESG